MCALSGDDSGYVSQNGHGRPVQVGLLHVFDFADGLICRESAWLDLASLQRQLAPPGP